MKKIARNGEYFSIKFSIYKWDVFLQLYLQKNKKRKKKKEDMKILRQKEKNTDILESNERTDAEEFPQRVTRVGGFRGQKKKKKG